MIPSRIAHNLALMRYTRLLTRRKITATEAEELASAVNEIVQSAIAELRAEIVAERDETRRRFFEVFPHLHPERGHLPPRTTDRPIVANLARLETTAPDAAHLESDRDVSAACSPSVVRTVP